jgi:hypothetical protein
MPTEKRILMRTGFGITGLIIAIAAIFAPYGINFIVGAIALLLVSIAALAGERVFATVTALLSAANLFLFSPVTLAAVLNTQKEVGLLTGILAFIALPFIAMALNASGKLALKR